MASIIEGYSYDIFISYRQKDNKHDGWVTEFVNNLKGELESTFKEEISVYFDINPHDGLLEIHDVDESLKDKLKCLVFIPIISRTYCDPKSFAWVHEFKAFVEQASKDQFGLKVKLPNGNVASRVLPVRIYDLDSADIKLCESVLGGVLRGVEYIYAEPGVNRPLKSDDDEKINLNKTKYRNQINKVGNAIKEVISGLKTEPVELGQEKPQHRELLEKVEKEEQTEIQKKFAKLPKRKLLSGSIIIAVLIVIAAIIAYPKIFKRNTLERLRASGERISVAVMPFQNMTNDTTWNMWQDGIKDELINYMTNYEDLRVSQTESINYLIQSKGIINYASITPSVANAISRNLDANVYINGSIKQAGSKIRVNAQIVDSKTKEPLKSFQIEEQSREDNIFPIIDSLSRMIKNFLIISKLKKESLFEIRNLVSTNNPDAYRYFIQGLKAFDNQNYINALNLFLNSICLDSVFYAATIYITPTYEALGLIDQAKKWCQDINNKSDILDLEQRYISTWLYARLFGTPREEIVILKQLLDLDNQQPFTYYEIGNGYNDLYEYEKAIPEYEKALGIYKKWNTKPRWARYYTNLGIAYHKTGQYKKEKRLYEKAEMDFPDDPALIYRQAVLALSESKSKEANNYINKYISLCKEGLTSEPKIAANLAGIYSEADIPDKAEEYYRQALTLETENPDRMNNLGYFLIINDRNINEGMDFVDKVLELRPDNYSYLHTKGWGLSKQGKYKESLETLQKSWDLRREKSVYNHEAYLHLEAAKKAVEGLK